MEIHSGVAVSPGIAIGQVFLLETEERNIPERRIDADEADAEIARLDQAIALAKRDLGTLREDLGMDSEIAGIFAAHDMVLADQTLRSEMERVVRQRLVSAEFAVAEVFDALVSRFESLDEAYFAQRASDMRDIERRLLRFLLRDRGEELARLSGGAVIAAHDLTPSQTASLDRDHVLGFVTDVGGRTSHTAINLQRVRQTE